MPVRLGLLFQDRDDISGCYSLGQPRVECLLPGRLRFCGISGAPEDGHSELWLSRPNQAPVRFAFADLLRPDVVTALEGLRQDGLTIELLSGDRTTAVADVAHKAGISCWRAEVVPSAKVDRLTELARAGKRALMVGDGLNDAPALAAAHASISPATAAEATQNAADAVFQGDALLPVLETLRVARLADRLVRQNLALALLYNLAAVPLAIAGLVTPLIAAVAMSSSSLVVIGNALRLSARGRRETA